MHEFTPDILPESNGRNPGAGVDHDLFLQCIHCGLCTSSCPTFSELGDENDGPRGRIQLMRSVAEGDAGMTDRMRRHLDRCRPAPPAFGAAPRAIVLAHLYVRRRPGSRG